MSEPWTWGIPELVAELRKIRELLESWQTVYKTQAGKEIPSLRTTTTIFDQTRR
jgi:hypothetical protein